MNPDFKEDDTAVAESPDAAVAGSDDTWNWDCDNTMHPFWAVRRMTANSMAKCVSQAAVGKPRPRFNCVIVTHDISCVTVGVLCNQSLNITRCFEVPLLCNSIPLREGEELILEIPEPKPQTQRKRSWKEAAKKEKEAEHNKKSDGDRSRGENKQARR